MGYAATGLLGGGRVKQLTLLIVTYTHTHAKEQIRRHDEFRLQTLLILCVIKFKIAMI